MLTIIAANTLVSIEKTDMGKVYLSLVLIVVLFLSLAIVQRINFFLEQRNKQKSAWRIFARLAKARGLVPAEIRLLTLATKGAKIKRPSQVLGSIHVFDRCVYDFILHEEISEKENASLESARQKLISTAELRSKNEDRRQVARAVAELPIQAHLIPRAWVQQQTKDIGVDNETQFQEIIENLKEEVVPVHGQIVDIGAGGVCLTTEEEPDFKEDDFVKLTGNLEALKIDLNGLTGQITSFEKQVEKGGFNLHVSFLPYAKDLKRQIIHLVYESEQKDTKSRDKTKSSPSNRGIAKFKAENANEN